MDRVFEVPRRDLYRPRAGDTGTVVVLYRNHCGFEPITAITMNESTMKIAE